MPLQQQTVAMRDGYDIGIGVTAGTGSPMALGISGEVTPPEVGPGGSGHFNFRRAEKSRDLETELGIDAEASAGVGCFSVSASMEFVKKCKIQSTSICVVVSATEKFAFQQIDSPTLTDVASKLVSEGKMSLFAERYGDYFVRGIGSGGRFVGVIRVETQSAQSRTDLEVALQGSYGPIDGEARIRISNALRTARAMSSGFYTYEGGQVSTRIKDNGPPGELVDQLYTAMDEWTASVRTMPKAYYVTLAPYVIALGQNPPNAADLANQRDVLIRCANLRSSTFDKLNLVDYILGHPDQFAIVPPPQGPNLSKLQAALANDLDVIAKTASYAIENPKQACYPEKFVAEIEGRPGFELTQLPTDLPQQTGPTLPPPANAMPDLVGKPAIPIIDVIQCIQLAGGRDHCVEPFMDQTVDGAVFDWKGLASFFQEACWPGGVQAIPNDLKVDIILVEGEKNLIVGQDPKPGDLVERSTVIRLYFTLAP